METISDAAAAGAQVQSSAPLTSRFRWIHWLLLAILLLAAAGVRAHNITKETLWLDEYWSLYLATGRAQVGTSIFDAPLGTLLNPPPATGFNGAPPWWSVWSGLSSAVHPPMFFIAMRWWVDLFGDSDFSVRGFSTILSLAGIVLLFNIVRKTQGAAQAFFASGLMGFAVSQINYSQQARGYTMLVLVALLSADALLRIEAKGANFRRLLWFGFSLVILSLTHYFAAGPILGMAVYAMIRLPGRSRRAVLITMAIAGIAVVTLWAPKMFVTRTIMLYEDGQFLHRPDSGLWSCIQAIISAPQRLLMENNPVFWWLSIPLAILVFIVPIVNCAPEIKAPPGKFASNLFWWIWVVASLLFVGVFDIGRHTIMLWLPRYILVASPGIFALLAVPLVELRKYRHAIPAAVLLCTIFFGAQRALHGPDITLHQWRELDEQLDKAAGPNDVIVFSTCAEFRPANCYLAFAHYHPDSKRPIVLVDKEPPDAATLELLAKAPAVWFIGILPTDTLQPILPNWQGQGPLLTAPTQLYAWRVSKVD